METDLRSARTRRSLPVAELAGQIGVHPMSVLRWERGERLPGPEHIQGLARALGVEPRQVARFFDDMRTPAPAAGVRGHGLRELRRRVGAGVPTLAASAGVRPSTVYNWEAGRARIPRDRLPGLAGALGLSPDRLAAELAAAPRAASGRPSAPPSPLRRLRHRARLTQQRAAGAAGVGRRSLGAWERGEGTPPLAAVRRLASAYGTSVAAVAAAAGIGAPPLLDPRRWGPGTLGPVVRTLRSWTGITQRELAVRCGCSTDTVRSWEAGRAVPSPRLLARVEDAFDLAPGSLRAAAVSPTSRPPGPRRPTPSGTDRFPRDGGPATASPAGRSGSVSRARAGARAQYRHPA